MRGCCYVEDEGEKKENESKRGARQINDCEPHTFTFEPLYSCFTEAQASMARQHSPPGVQTKFWGQSGLKRLRLALHDDG